MNKNKIKIFTGVFCVFLLGATLGGVGTHIYSNYQFQKFVNAPPDFIFPKVIEKIQRKLDLSENQQKKVKKQFNLLKNDFLAFREKHRPEFEKIKDAHISEIEKNLTPVQRQKLDQLIKNIKKRWLNQSGGSGKDKSGNASEGMMLFLQNHLQLGNEQMNKIRLLLRKDFIETRMDAEYHFRSGNLFHNPAKLRLRALDGEARKELETILTADQILKLNQLIKRREEEAPGDP